LRPESLRGALLHPTRKTYTVSRGFALHRSPTRTNMLNYAVVFLIIAIIAAVFGFGGIAAGAAEIAKILFFIFLVLFVVSLLFGIFRRGS
jgi:uncharacterized membrane protein YtjA (UPF0391 family)